VGASPIQVQLPWLTTGGGPSGGPTSGFLPGECQAQQVVSTTSGRQVSRPAGPCEFHLEHAHFHYKDLISYSLHRPGPNGAIGPEVARSQKASFCLTDDDYFGFAGTGPNGPRNFVGQPGCNVPAEVTLPPSSQPAGASVVEGISPGWGDVYTWDTPGQFIDITHVASGTYDVVEKTNPNGALLVAGPDQTCALTVITLNASSVRVLSTNSSVPCPAT
jgi:hypothetical protein